MDFYTGTSPLKGTLMIVKTRNFILGLIISISL